MAASRRGSEAGFDVEHHEPPPRAPGSFVPQPPLAAVVSYEALRARLDDEQTLILDARAPDRFAGQNETLDPVGGHIPGARNQFFRLNLAAHGRFKPAEALRAIYGSVLGTRMPGAVVATCGSGVTACHNLLAMEIAGLGGATLYPGSWSEWCSRPDAPIA